MAWQEGEFSAPVVLRSQAEELLAAERGKKEDLIREWAEAVAIRDADIRSLKDLNSLHVSANAALTARAKELRIDRAAWEAVATDIRKQAKDLEAKLTAAHKDIDRLSDELNDAEEEACDTETALMNEQVRAETAETKLAAAEKALEVADTAITLADKLIERGYGSDTPKEWHKALVASQKARAALGGKPS